MSLDFTDVRSDWTQPIRLKHLYAARDGLHLQIRKDGNVDGSPQQSALSLMEIRPVDNGCVAIKGIASSKFLCLERDGRLYGSNSYVRDDCAFVEQILPDGYNVYSSRKHGTLLSLSVGTRSQARGHDKGLSSHAQFLPMANNLKHSQIYQSDSGSLSEHHQSIPLNLQIDSMDPFGKVSQIYIQSPSFNKR
ncbi:fibroblast growth factor 19 isoform X2 [Clupea harengus]|uniref:Fibroblast growth factor n=1 Tax=Clupea harengus TaxID=7950 RepID=A0A6P8FP74_CLUHA|nr:fibroblast growth factor 19 isoform X2 [Clupea harengus]